MSVPSNSPLGEDEILAADLWLKRACEVPSKRKLENRSGFTTAEALICCVYEYTNRGLGVD